MACVGGLAACDVTEDGVVAAEQCTAAAAADVCPAGSVARLASESTADCGGTASGSFSQIEGGDGSITGAYAASDECTFECIFQTPCRYDMQTLSREAIVYNTPCAACGDGVCEDGETVATCPSDCTVACGNGECEAGESLDSCPQDCTVACGNGECERGESPASCPQDCGTACGDGDCEEGEDVANCPRDCSAACGNGACEEGENVASCPSDCAAPCEPGTERCDGSIREICNARGQYEDLECSLGLSCVEGAGGTTRCVDPDSIICDDETACCRDGLARNEGGPCDDGDACTVGDVCRAGVCASGAPVVCSATECVVSGVCDSETGLCDGVAAEDGVDCRPSNAQGECLDGGCNIVQCTGRFRDCNLRSVDGCEADPQSDPRHCGACGVSCEEDYHTGRCLSGRCELEVGAGWAYCPGQDVAVNTDADTQNCGSCGNRCVRGCIDGACEQTLGALCNSNSECASNEWCSTVDGFERCAPRLFVGQPHQMDFAFVPAGTFEQGTPGATDDERPYTSTISRDYFVSRTEVTQGQWRAASGTVNPSCFQSTTGTSCTTSNANNSGPVENLDWWSALRYANWLSSQGGLQECYSVTGCTENSSTGWHDGDHDAGCASATFIGQSCTGYRLLTEAEWERAARGGTTTSYYWGESTESVTMGQYAWYSLNSGSRTQTVGRKLANAYGLFDMSGNVWEVVWDRYVVAYPSGPTTDYSGPSSSPNTTTRGGSFDFDASFARSGRRGVTAPQSRVNRYGMRLARTIP